MDAGPPTSYGGIPVDVVEKGSRQSGYGPGECAPAEWHWPATGRQPQPPVNTYAILALIFGLVVPPAGVALGHLALPQIKRSGERGRSAAVCGLVVGYVLSAMLIAILLWLLMNRNSGKPPSAQSGLSAVMAPPESVVTSIAPGPKRPRHKIALDRATVGMCAEIEKRDIAKEIGHDDALELFEVPCEHRVGVYTVVGRVPTDADCNSTYVAAPPDRSFAVCLNRF
ncbi:DUF4190 domain-containing protein [Mycobacterium sp. THU-M104]|uniref:DUF4190 domain-containing protein n=1 Tax=Mycobacterium sp. THU-M104 TaxID=3410515 RepID=UPI003BA05B4D